MKEKDERMALFWCGLLSPIIFSEINEKEVNGYLRKLSEQQHLMPNGKTKRISISTLRRKLNKYKEGGFLALARKTRSDRGKIRSVEQEIIERAIELKKDQAFRCDEAINRFLINEYGKTIPRSTLYRHLRKAGATRLKLGVTGKPVRKRWTKKYSNQMWVGDFEHGPYVLVDGEAKKTHLSLFIDVYSRYIIEARYYLKENLDILIDSLLRAWGAHGSSSALYLDNAKIYQSNSLNAACYELNIKLIFRKPGEPEGGGVVERAFLTVQQQFEAEVRAGSIFSLEELNRAFSAWLNVSYHTRIHSETKQSPKERYQQGLTVVRHVDIEKILPFFLKTEIRTVDRTFSDIRLYGKFYRVPHTLRADKVKVKYDPYATEEVILVYSLEDEYLTQAKPYQREYGEKVEPQQPSKSKHDYIKLLIDEHNKQLAEKTPGIDYRQVISQRQWPFTKFIQTLARLMGRKGGASAFDLNEHKALRQIYNKYPKLDEALLIEAFENSQFKNIVSIAHQLQLITRR